ncbi:alpha-L-fucosidase [Arthrobacter pigmenti]|uniref:alpha-L-fucosidase n=1 Tax=Arthrobacter pigmenti TaxID=271432 RepID=A0A846RDF6_9MICC|nr:alpha-L-fucosidase [Arthrobacter pigmenti]
MNEHVGHSLPSWATEASLGIFIHWGPYSVPAWAVPSGVSGSVPEEEWFAHNAYAEWYANTIRINGSPAAQHHFSTYGDMPYDGFLDLWRAEQYQPAEWAGLFKAAGADYVVPVTKHHDGVTLWDAPGSGQLNTVRRGPKRDLLQPLADAVRAEDMRFGVYYSGGLDWSVTELPPQETFDSVTALRPNDEAYAAYATAHVRDLIDRYQPSVLWNDIEWPDAGKSNGTIAELFAYYREAVPDGIVNDRWGTDDWDFRTSEYALDAHHETGTGWEHNRGLGFSFGYNQLEDESTTLQPRELARQYADIVSRGGRLLLNVGPDAAGRIPAVQRRTLEGIAPWMARVKPTTAGRELLKEADIAVTFPNGTNGWWRGWSTRGAVVVVTDEPDVEVVSRQGRKVQVIELPV